MACGKSGRTHHDIPSSNDASTVLEMFCGNPPVTIIARAVSVDEVVELEVDDGDVSGLVVVAEVMIVEVDVVTMAVDVDIEKVI